MKLQLTVFLCICAALVKADDSLEAEDVRAAKVVKRGISSYATPKSYGSGFGPNYAGDLNLGYGGAQSLGYGGVQNLASYSSLGYGAQNLGLRGYEYGNPGLNYGGVQSLGYGNPVYGIQDTGYGFQDLGYGGINNLGGYGAGYGYGPQSNNPLAYNTGYYPGSKYSYQIPHSGPVYHGNDAGHGFLRGGRPFRKFGNRYTKPVYRQNQPTYASQGGYGGFGGSNGLGNVGYQAGSYGYGGW